MAWFKTKVTESENISDKYNTLLCSYNELQDYVKKVLEEKNKEISTLSENIIKKDKELKTKSNNIETLNFSNKKMKDDNEKLNEKLKDLYFKQKTNMNFSKETSKIIDNYLGISQNSKYDNGYLYLNDKILKNDNDIAISFDWDDGKYIPSIWNTLDDRYVDINYTTLHSLGFDYTWNLLKTLKNEKDDESLFMLDYICNSLNENTPNIIEKIKKDIDFDKIIKVSICGGSGNGNYPYVTKEYADSLGFKLVGSVLNDIRISNDIVCFRHDGYGITVGFDVFCKMEVTENGVIYPIVKIEKNDLQKLHL